MGQEQTALIQVEIKNMLKKGDKADKADQVSGWGVLSW